jgi:hypothetical protein
MAAKDLITLARAYQALPGITGIDALLEALITCCSDGIEKYCRRRFVSTFYDEVYNGDGDRRLSLRQYPVQSVQSVRYRPVTVLYVQNTNQLQNQQARVSVTSTGLSLFRMASGISSTDTSVTWAGNPTLNACVQAINALGNGWSAQVVGDAGAPGYGDYGLWPSSDLYCPNSYGDPLEQSGIQTSQGAMNARGVNAELKMHTYELSGYQWDARGWLLRAIPYTDPELLHPEDLIFPVGINNFRIQYTAGYTTIPEAVQQACATWVGIAYYLTLRDPMEINVVPVAGTAQGFMQAFGGNGASPPNVVRSYLAPYRRYTVGINQG